MKVRLFSFYSDLFKLHETQHCSIMKIQDLNPDMIFGKGVTSQLKDRLAVAFETIVQPSIIVNQIHSSNSAPQFFSSVGSVRVGDGCAPQ